MTYRPARPGRHATVTLRGLDHHVVRWGPDSGDPVLFLHGYADAAATFQFVADEIDPELPMLAIDWRGFGASARSPGGYWFPDYYADLEAMIDAFCPSGPARVVGHSMGANVAMIYAGARPARIARLVNLEGLGLARTDPAQAPDRIGRWLDEVGAPPAAGEYASLEELPIGDGRVRLLTDPAHRRVNPYLYRREEMEACWRRIEAPVLMVFGRESELLPRLVPEGGVASFGSFLRKLAIEEVAGAGHMLHHEQPRAVARLIEAFFGQPVP
jgi:pimeloyl-ACP methyl ester carboxylesterase